MLPRLTSHYNTSGELCPITHQDEKSASCIDYWLVSPACGNIFSQTVIPMPGHKHRAVAIQIQQLARAESQPISLPPVRYTQSERPVQSCCPVDWGRVRTHIRALLMNHQMEDAWHIWQQQYHLDLSSRSLSAPKKAPGSAWYTYRKWRDRITSQGEEGADVALMYTTARRLLDFSRDGGVQAKKKISRAFLSLPALSMLLSEQEAFMHPVIASQLIYTEAQRLQCDRKKQAVKKWEQALLNPRDRPNPSLYRWLKGEAPATVIGVESAHGPTHTMQHMFDAHRQYWQDICTGEPGSLVQSYVHIAPLTGNDLMQATHRVKAGTAPGLDNWPAEAAMALSRDSSDSLADIFNFIEQQGIWPQNLARVKVTLINKPGVSGRLPAHWRPLSITSVWYRLYAQARLPFFLHYLLPHLPPTVLGGIPGRVPSVAIMKLLLAFEEHAMGRPAEDIWGVALDASKCFDRVQWPVLWTHLASLPIPQQILSAMSSFYSCHERHTVIRGCLDKTSWSVSAGLLQGCPLSVAACLALVSTWHHSIPDHTTAQSYIDDRLLLSDSPNSLIQSWTASEAWNAQNGWVVNLEKTVGFASDMREVPHFPVNIVDSFAYLGHDVRVRPKADRKILKGRATKASETCNRISRLPQNITIRIRQFLISTVVAPQWAYGLLIGPPSKAMQYQMDQAIKRAMWQRSKAMHSWPLALAIVYHPHRASAWGTQMYSHARNFLNSLSHDCPPEVLILWNGPPPLRISGPVHTFLHCLRECEWTINRDLKVVPPGGEELTIPQDNKKILTSIVGSMRYRELRRAQSHRPHLEGLRDADLDVTMRLFRRKRLPQISCLVSVVCDGLWTGHRLIHSGHTDTKQCWWCEHEEQTAAHLFWYCPRWASERPSLSEDAWTQIRNYGPALCAGICGQTFSDDLKRQWTSIQLFMAKVAEGLGAHFDLQSRLNRVPRGGPRGEGVVRGSLGAPSSLPPSGGTHPGQAMVLGSRLINFDAMVARHAHGSAWAYSARQWHRLANYVALLRIATGGGGGSLRRLSTLEIYVSYVLLNGGYRFVSGTGPLNRGEWVSSHLGAFENALASFQRLAMYDEVFPVKMSSAKKADWLAGRGLPPSVELRAPVLIPNLPQVDACLEALSSSVPCLNGEERPAADLWRRLVLGKPGSQLLDEGGAIPTTPIIWRKLVRFRGKAPPPTWHRQILDTRPYRRALEGRPEAWMDAGDGKKVLDLLVEAGIATKIQLGAYFTSQRNQLARIEKFLLHATLAKQNRQHLTVMASTGMRPIRAACKRTGTLARAYSWIRGHCEEVMRFDESPVVEALAQQKERLLRLLPLLARLK